MPKQPILRPTFKSDAKYFRRLAHAIENDDAKPRWWKDQVNARINELIHFFEGADDVWEETPPPETKEKTQTGV